MIPKLLSFQKQPHIRAHWPVNKEGACVAGLTAGECAPWSSMESAAAQEGDQRQRELRGSPRDFHLPDGSPHGGVGRQLSPFTFISAAEPPHPSAGARRLYTQSPRTGKCCQTCIPPTATLLHINARSVAYEKQLKFFFKT